MSQAQNTNSASVSGLDNLSYLNQSGTAQTLTVKAERVPNGNDRRYKIGTIWIDISTNKAFILTSVTGGQANWGLSSVGTGDLETLTGDTGGAISPDTNGNISILGGVGVTVDGTPETLTINAGSDNFPITPFVVGPVGDAEFQTIQAGLDAANTAGGGVVGVQPDTYTEDLTLYPNTWVVGLTNSLQGSNVIIVGKHTPPNTGEFGFDRVQLESATHIFDSNAAGTGLLYINNAGIKVTNGYMWNVPNWVGPINGNDIGDVGSTNNGVVNNSGASIVFLNNGVFGAGTGNTMTSDAPLTRLDLCEIACPSNISGGFLDINIAFFTQTMTLSSTVQGIIFNALFATGAAKCLDVTTSGTFSIFNSVFESSNDPAIDGTGTIALGSATFLINSNIATAMTVAYFKETSGITSYVVGGPGTYSTVQAAIDAANKVGGGTVWINSGTYTENLTLFDKVNLYGAVSSEVTITGLHTPPTSGAINFQNLTLASATHIFSSGAAGSTQINLEQCILDVTDGYVFFLINWTGSLSMDDCLSIGTNDGGVINASGATVKIVDSTVGAGGAVSTNEFDYQGGNVTLENCVVDCRITFDDLSVVTADLGTKFNGVLTANGDAIITANDVTFTTGATDCIIYESSGTFVLTNATLSSSATPISGSGGGTFKIGLVTFTDAIDIDTTIFDIQYLPQTSGTTPYVVGGSGLYSTIQSAINAANAAGVSAVVSIQDGSYTEDLTLFDNVCLQGMTKVAVTITGVHTPPTSGTIQFENLTLASATDILNSAAAGTTEIFMEDCNVAVTSGYVMNLLNWTGQLNVRNMSAITSTNDGFINNTGGSVTVVNSSLVGAGSNIFVSSGARVFNDTLFQCELSCTDFQMTVTGCFFLEPITVSGGIQANIFQSTWKTGNQTPFIMDATSNVLISDVTFETSNTTAIGGTGTGTLQLGTVTFVEESGIASTVTIDRKGTLETGIAKSRFAIETGDDIIFSESPIMQSIDDAGDPPTGGNGDINLMCLQKGVIMEQFLISAQSIRAPRMNSTGLLTSLDLQTAAGAEYNYGGARSNSKHAFTIGTSNPFFIELEVNVADVSGVAPLFAGFRKVEANNAVMAAYTDYVGIGLQSVVNTGTAIIQTRLNSGAVTSTNTTDAWADAATHTVRANVSSTGVVTFTFDGAAPTATQAFTFDTGDVVVPYIHHLFVATTPADINWVSMKVGFQE